MSIDALRLYAAAEYDIPAIQYAEFSLDNASTSESYILQQGWGFDLDEILPHFSGTNLTDDYYKMVPKERLIVMKIKLNPQLVASETIESLRDHLYRVIASSRTGLVELRVMSNGSTVKYIQGKIKKFENDPWSSEPQVQISILCENPYFRSPSFVDLSATAAVLAPHPTLVITDNQSTAPHGFKMRIRFTGTHSTFFQINSLAGGSVLPFRINRDGAASFVTNDLLYFSSEQDDKHLYYVKYSDSSTKLLFDSIAINQIWPMIFPGENRFTWYTNPSPTPTSAFVIEMFKYRNQYWGL